MPVQRKPTPGDPYGFNQLTSGGVSGGPPPDQGGSPIDYSYLLGPSVTPVPGDYSPTYPSKGSPGSEPIPSRSSESPRERAGGGAIPRQPNSAIPPPAQQDPLENIVKLLSPQDTFGGGGTYTPEMPSAPHPAAMTHSTPFIGGQPPGGALFGAEGGLLGGGLGVPHSSAGTDDPSALIQLLLSKLGVQ